MVYHEFRQDSVTDEVVRMARPETLLIRLSATEKTSFKAAAKVAGISLSSWVRERLRSAATRELEAAAQPIAFLEELKGSGNGKEITA